VPEHGVHDDGEPPGERDPRLPEGSLMGQGQQLGSEGDVVGCLCSLRAHAALDGVSWVRSGLVAIAVG